MKRFFFVLIVLFILVFPLSAAITSLNFDPVPSAKSGTLLYNKNGNKITFSNVNPSSTLSYKYIDDDGSYKEQYYMYNSEDGILINKNTKIKVKYELNGKSTEKEFQYIIALPRPSVSFRAPSQDGSVEIRVNNFSQYPSGSSVLCSYYHDYYSNEDVWTEINNYEISNDVLSFSVKPYKSVLKLKITSDNTDDSPFVSATLDVKKPSNYDKLPFGNVGYFLSDGTSIYETIITENSYNESNQDEYVNDPAYREGFERIDEVFSYLIFNDYEIDFNQNPYNGIIYAIFNLIDRMDLNYRHIDFVSFFFQGLAIYPTSSDWEIDFEMKDAPLILLRKYKSGNESKLEKPKLSFSYEDEGAVIERVGDEKRDEEGYLVSKKEGDRNWCTVSFPLKLYLASDDTDYLFKFTSTLPVDDSDEVKITIKKGEKLPLPAFTFTEENGIFKYILINRDMYKENAKILYKESEEDEYTAISLSSTPINLGRKNEDRTFFFKLSCRGFEDSDELKIVIPKYTRLEEMPSGSASPYNEKAYIINKDGYILEVIPTELLYSSTDWMEYQKDENYADGFRALSEVVPSDKLSIIDSSLSPLLNEIGRYFPNVTLYYYTNHAICYDGSHDRARLLLSRLLKSPENGVLALTLPRVGVTYDGGKAKINILNIFSYDDDVTYQYREEDGGEWKDFNTSSVELYRNEEDTIYIVKAISKKSVDSPVKNIVVKKGEKLPSPIINSEDLNNGYLRLTLTNYSLYPEDSLIQIKEEGEDNVVEIPLSEYKVPKGEEEKHYFVRITALGFSSSSYVSFTLPKGDELPPPILSFVENGGMSKVDVTNASEYPVGVKFIYIVDEKEYSANGGNSFSISRIKDYEISAYATCRGYRNSGKSESVKSTGNLDAFKTGMASPFTDGAFIVNEDGYILEFKLSSGRATSQSEFLNIVDAECGDEHGGWKTYQIWCTVNGFYASYGGNTNPASPSGWYDGAKIIKNGSNKIQSSLEDVIKANKTKLNYSENYGPIIGRSVDNNYPCCILWYDAKSLYTTRWGTHGDGRVLLVRDVK